MHSEHVVHQQGHNERISDDNSILFCFLRRIMSLFLRRGVGIGSRQCGRSQPLYIMPSPAFRTAERFSPKKEFLS